MTTKLAKLLVAVNFDPASERALAFAQQLSGPLHAQLILVHVFTPPLLAYPTAPIDAMTRLYAELEDAARSSLDDLAARSGNPRTILRRGDPASEILAVMSDVKPTMVVMGTHGRRGVERAFLGSTAEYVARRATVPVLLMRSSEGESPA